MKPLVPALALAGVLALSGCAAFSDDAARRLRRQGPGGRRLLPAPVRRRSGSPATTPTSTNLTQPGAEPHDLEIPPKQTAEIVDADLVVYEHGFQPAVDDAIEQNATGAAGRRREGGRPRAPRPRRPRPRRRGPRARRGPRPRRPRPALLAGPAAARQGRRRRRRRAGRRSTRSTPTTTPPTRPPCARTSTSSTGPTTTGLASCERRHRRGLARRVRLPRQVRSRHGAHRRPLPRGRADAGRPGPAAGPDPHRRHHHRLLRAAGQPPAEPSPWPPTWGSRPRSSTRSRASATQTADEDYLSLMQREPRRPARRPNGCR